jgi:hypothetical protein
MDYDASHDVYIAGRFGATDRGLAAMRAGRQRWLEEMRAKKAGGEIDRFPGGRKSGSG